MQKIKTERLILRPFTEDDAERYFEITRDPEIQKYVKFYCPKTLEKAKENIKFWEHLEISPESDSFVLAIEETSSKNLIGAFVAYKSTTEKHEICMLISEEYRCQGYMTEVLRAFIKFMPEGSKLNFDIKLENLPSISVVEKIGAKQVFKGISRTTYVYTC